jgi:hypothetical protein
VSSRVAGGDAPAELLDALEVHPRATLGVPALENWMRCGHCAAPPPEVTWHQPASASFAQLWPAFLTICFTWQTG